MIRAPREEIIRYEGAAPGEPVHLDIKKLGRIVRPGHRVTGDRSRRSAGAGWQYLYGAIDDQSRLGFAAVHPDETADSALRLQDELVAFSRAHGIIVKRVPDRQRHPFQAPLGNGLLRARDQGERDSRLPPQTNGKAERFIRTLLERWAYAYSYETEPARLAALPPALHFYNASVLTPLLEVSRRCSASTTP